MYQNGVKRGFDLLFAIIFLVVACLPMIVVAVLIGVTTGDSPIFIQQRFGKYSRPFKLYKFRSLSTKAPILANKDFADMDGYLTPIGKIIRSTSIDELPQIFNILRGEMSFIGPRPLAKTDARVLELRRQNGADQVLPGITGLAQINGRNNISDEDKATYDMRYAQNVCCTLDIQIVCQTVRKVLCQDDVYKA
jgi:O-antigen biosynthesis protein WbqP